MSNHAPSLSKKTVHLFFSPPKAPCPLKTREEHFVLDCVNPSLSRLRQYQPNMDHYNQSYLSGIFSRIQAQKENRSPRTSDLPHRPRLYERAVSREDFRNYLSQKLNLIAQVSPVNGEG
jgi:hypothetical protein